MANIDVNQTNRHGEGALHVAAGLGQLDILKVHTNSMRKICQEKSPLGLLMMKKPGGIITTRNFSQVLAKKGGNLGMVDNRGDSAVYWAARQGHQDVVQYLISQGVHVNQQNKVSQIVFVI